MVIFICVKIIIKRYFLQLIKKEDVKTASDKIILYLSFVFDLNYDYSKQTILEKGYYDKILEHIKDKDKFRPYFDEAKKYLKGE